MALRIPVPGSCNVGTTVSGTTAYTTLTGTTGLRCSGGNCHNSAIMPKFTSQATFMAAVLNKSSTADFKYIVPGQPDGSYILYKLRNLQTMVRNGGGKQMPLNGPYLSDAEFCTLYNWVRGGAPAN